MLELPLSFHLAVNTGAGKFEYWVSGGYEVTSDDVFIVKESDQGCTTA